MASATLAAMPFLDALECSQVLGHAERTVYWRLREMERAGLACSLYHSLPSGHGSRRFALTTKGLGDLAQQQRVTLEELIARYPISDHWYRTLLVRLDHVALLYRAAASIVQGAGASPFRWRRRGPIDAVISLPGGVHLALSCRGPASNKISYAPRFRRIWRDHYPSAVFIILPSANDLREMRQRMDSLPLPVFTTTSLHLAQSSPESPVWFTPAGGHPVRPGEAVSLLTAAPQPPGERPMRRLKPPGPLCYAAEAPPRHMLASALFPTEKVVLSLLYEWPWLRQGHIPSLLGITPKHVSKVISRLNRFGLVAERTGRLETSLALSDQALRYIAQKDRIPVHLTLRRWSTAPIDPTAPFHWRNVVGTRARQLLRDMEHTEAVHDFLAQLGNEVRGGAWELSYLQPPPLAVRHFSHGLERHSIQPDAFVGITGGLSAGSAVPGVVSGMGAPCDQADHDEGSSGPLSAVLCHAQTCRGQRAGPDSPGSVRGRTGLVPVFPRCEAGDGWCGSAVPTGSVGSRYVGVARGPWGRVALAQRPTGRGAVFYAAVAVTGRSM